ncbi:hypothetical protein ES705_27822 [subsurface metagenome]
MVFYTHYSRPEKAPFMERNDGPKITDPSHVPATAQIESMILAGVRLKEYRRELYHFEKPDEVPEDFEDNTLRSDYDLVDASMDLEVLKEKKDNAIAYSKKVDSEIKKRELKEKAEKEAALKLASDPEKGSD